MNYKFHFHGTITVARKDAPNDKFSIEPIIDCVIKTPSWVKGKFPNLNEVTTDDSIFHSFLKAQLENMYPDFNIDFELYKSELNEYNPEGKEAID